MDNVFRKNLLPFGATLILLVGAVMILASFTAFSVRMFVGSSQLGGQSLWLCDILAVGGGVSILLGGWLSKHWYKKQQ